jgi:hypothetical protein
MAFGLNSFKFRGNFLHPDPQCLSKRRAPTIDFAQDRITASAIVIK